uniref:Uncharacterized protein n=1 Tax=Arundo donax TaxID=35708 RepID=A0A0A8Y033_ARUDO
MYVQYSPEAVNRISVTQCVVFSRAEQRTSGCMS